MAKTDLKRKTVNGFFWGLLESFFSQGQGFIFGIVLARLLSPQEFGLIGMITIFISIAQVFVDSGLSQALIRKQDCTSTDYSTVFWANVSIGVIAYILIWLFAPFIASFYAKPELIQLTRVTALAIIIGSLTLIQQTIIIKEVDFKTNTKISTIGTFVSGIISIGMAFYGFGVWSLVWRTIINQMVRSLLLWKHNKWLPDKKYSISSFKELFRFGSNILFISIIAAIFKNFYNLIIGKNYSDKMLGYYTNADQYSAIPSTTLTTITNKVSYPILATIQDDNEKLKLSSRKLIQTIMYGSFFIMFGLAAFAHPLFSILFGAKWLPSVKFFQALCIAYSITPMHTVNQNIMKIKGRSDLFLITEIIKYVVFVPFIILGIIYGLFILILGIVVFYWISFYINAMYSRKLIHYSTFEQTIDIMPVMLVSLIPGILVYMLDFWLKIGNIPLIIIQSIAYLAMVLGLSIIFKLPAYIEIKQIFINKLTLSGFINILKNNHNE